MSPEQTPQEQQPVPLTENPDLLAIAATDEQLADRLRALHRADQLVQGNPDDPIFRTLRSGMDEAVRGYLETSHYQWEEVYPDNTTEQP